MYCYYTAVAWKVFDKWKGQKERPATGFTLRVSVIGPCLAQPKLRYAILSCLIVLVKQRTVAQPKSVESEDGKNPTLAFCYLTEREAARR